MGNNNFEYTFLNMFRFIGQEFWLGGMPDWTSIFQDRSDKTTINCLEVTWLNAILL